MKRKHSEDTVEVYPRKKVNLPAALENGPRGRRAVHSKAKRNEGSFSLHPSSKVARSDSLVITRSLKPEQTLMVIQDGGLSSHQVVPLKRKCSEEILETHPPNKVARVVEQGNDLPSSAYPHSNEVSCDNLQGCNSRTYLDDPVVQSQQCPMWSLPDELLMLVLAYLPRKSLWTLTQVCRLFREIASPPLFKILHFEPPQAPATLHIEFGMLEALSVWRRTDAFIMPVSIWFSVTGATTDRHLKALSTFFESLQGCEPAPRVHLQLPTAPRQPTDSFVRLLDCIQASGCKNFHCHDVQQTYGVPRTSLKSSSFTNATPSRGSKFEVLELTSSLFFSPMIIPFTIATLCSSPITHLTLTNTSLTAMQWSTLLKHLSMQHLLSLRVDSSCPIQSLVNFLAHHSIRDLILSRDHPTTVLRSPRMMSWPVLLISPT
ncbi:hypothetical protein F5141DRAFT_1069494 [Pisolithus sp. B1]|nr:hypothetical protein F5141DRAFT_1069494 [Pisolithus sp. B1]